MVESATLTSPTIYRDNMDVDNIFPESRELLKHFMYRKLLYFGSYQIGDIVRAWALHTTMVLEKLSNAFFDEFGEKYSDVVVWLGTKSRFNFINHDAPLKFY